MEHELNGEHGNVNIQCLEKGDANDRWQVKREGHEADILIIHHEDGEFTGWDLEGCRPASLVKDNTATDELQAILDIFADEY